MQVPFPYFKILYNNKNITDNITDFIESVVYVDKVSGESDEISIKLFDGELKFQNGSYPDKGATLTVEIGMNDSAILNCGTFQIDQVKLSGPPDMVSLNGIATGIDAKLKTKKSTAHENKTLRQIVNSVAAQNGFTIVGTIQNITIGRVTQYRESDLAFLNKLALEYGYAFSIRGKQLVFTSVYELEGKAHILTLDKTDLTSYDFTDNTMQTYKEANVKSHNPNENKVVKGKTLAAPVPEQRPFNVFDYTTYGPPATANTDTLEDRTKAENEPQANAKSKAKLHQKNSKSKILSGTTSGNVLLVSGVNFELTGFGELSGIYHVTESKHPITRSGYITSFEAKRVNAVAAGKKLPKKQAVVKPTPDLVQKRPFNVFDPSTF